MISTTSSWGLFVEDGFHFLHEPGVASCVTPGLEALASPFVPYVPRRLSRMCPHGFAALRGEAPLPIHPLFEAIRPGADAAIAVRITAIDFAWFKLYGRPTGPSPFLSTWADGRLRTHADLLTQTNLVALFVRYRPADRPFVAEFAELPRTRPLVLIGSNPIHGVPLLPHDMPARDDWPAVGATAFRALTRTQLA